MITITEEKKWCKEEILIKIEENDTWLIRGMLAIHKNQTSDEICSQQTIENNGIGFNGLDAKILSSFCEFYTKHKFLSEKQLAIARKKMKKYCGQLTKIANKKNK
jgi:hypothetical protein